MYSEKHRSIKEISQLWGMSQAVVRELFRDEPDVIKLRRPESIRAHKREYCTLRVPESVMKRVHAQMAR